MKKGAVYSRKEKNKEGKLKLKGDNKWNRSENEGK
jgi:hypothetical protein